MRVPTRVLAVALAVSVAVVATSCRDRGDSGPPDRSGDSFTIERTDYSPPPTDANEELTDDTLESKPAKFDPELIDRRPLEGWRVNVSDAVLRLDVPLIRPDSEAALLGLSPSYASAVKDARRSISDSVLPSVNMIDGKAKQFDDGLYAALDQAYYRGLGKALLSHVELIKRLHAKVGPESVAAPYLAAALELAGVKAEASSSGEKERWLRAFKSNEILSKPISFYAWNPTLSDCFRFLRFFQQPFATRDLPIAHALAGALSEDRALLGDYQRAIEFYSKLTNPPLNHSVADLIGPRDLKAPLPVVSLFPSSTSRETELFLKLFPQGFPPDVDLMRELVKRIRSGSVDLKPRPNSGWYDYQVYALETLLLPERGEEHAKLLLTKAYKKRMLEAFKALMTKRRETHARQIFPAASAAPPPPRDVKVGPRLRLEPCPSYYLRTARAYAFLADFLESTVGEAALKSLHGLREGKEQAADLSTELSSQRDLFYGFYLLSAEDIGLKPTLLDGEVADRGLCEKLAADWLSKALEDTDLAADTRVSVPINYDPARNVTRLWITLGVRMTRLSATYARAPRIKPAEGEGEWKPVPPHQLLGASYLIPVDEFAEVELKGARALDRQELRAICDQYQTKEAIIGVLQK